MPAKQNLRIHQFLPLSYANGPGARAVLWVQGCTLACPGCFNAPTHPQASGQIISVDALFECTFALKDTIEGITISGGEPLQQQTAVAALLRRIKAETALSVVLFTGFSWAEIEKFKLKPQPPVGGRSVAQLQKYPLALLDDVDVLIAGRYDERQHIARDLRGSANKTSYFLTNRYTAADFDTIAPAEVVITPEGDIIMSGIDPLKW